VTGLKNFICFLVSLILFCSCSGNSMKYDISPDEKAVNTAMARNSQILSKKYHLRPFGITVAMPDGDIQYLALEFQICGPLSKQDLRKILIDAAHDFLADINSNTELCSYLKNHSLNIKEIGIVLFLIDSSGRGLRNPHISIAEISKGELEYAILVDTYDEELKRNIPSFKSKYHESYEDALTIVNEKKY
jgi:hypothetical protein